MTLKSDSGTLSATGTTPELKVTEFDFFLDLGASSQFDIQVKHEQLDEWFTVETYTSDPSNQPVQVKFRKEHTVRGNYTHSANTDYAFDGK